MRIVERNAVASSGQAQTLRCSFDEFPLLVDQGRFRRAGAAAQTHAPPERQRHSHFHSLSPGPVRCADQRDCIRVPFRHTRLRKREPCHLPRMIVVDPLCPEASPIARRVARSRLCICSPVLLAVTAPRSGLGATPTRGRRSGCAIARQRPLSLRPLASPAHRRARRDSCHPRALLAEQWYMFAVRATASRSRGRTWRPFRARR